MAKNWYVIQVYSGYEKTVKSQIEIKTILEKSEHLFGGILIPTEPIIEIRAGQKRKSERKFFPGYIIINMEINELSFRLIKSIPRVSGFVGGSGNQPTPISQLEIDNILKSIKKNKESSPRHRTMFDIGETVRILYGPFTEFTGTVESINYEKSKLHVAVWILGRSTPVQLEFSQVEKDS